MQEDKNHSIAQYTNSIAIQQPSQKFSFMIFFPSSKVTCNSEKKNIKIYKHVYRITGKLKYPSIFPF